MYIYILSYFLFISSCLKADTNLQNQPIHITSQLAPNSFVNGSVNAIDGSFSYTFHHLAVPGHVPLDVVQHYNSKSRYSSWLGRGMSLNYSFWIAGSPDFKKNTHPHAFVEGSGGSIIHCRAENKWFLHARFYLDPKVIEKGLTNLGSGYISARTNLKNVRVDYKIDKGLAKWNVQLPDGTMREYYKTDNFPSRINIRTESRLNRTRLDFHYYKYHEKEGDPRKIEAHGNSLELDVKPEHRSGKINTSNGKEAKFHYFEWNGGEYIDEVTSSDNPTVELHYQRVQDNLCIDRITWPKGRFLEIEYDTKARVKKQKAPVGKEGAKWTIYSLDYHDKYTKVHDAYDRKTIYRHKKERLEAVEEYGKSSSSYRTHKYFWGRLRDLKKGKHPDSDDGNLISEVLLDSERKAHSVHHFTYDKWGNVSVETIYGNLSGSGALSKISPYGLPESSSVEQYKKYFWYSADRLHLPKYEWHDNGLAFEYHYERDTDLMCAKYTKDGDKILMREFYSYDKDGILVEKILDNGTNPNKDVLTGVTQRLITTIVSTGVGLPKSITESYLDLTTQQPVLVKQQKFSYNKAGLVTGEQVFDAKNNLCYTLETTYNDKGRVIWRTNELGQKFEYDYDANCNKIYEKQHGVGFYTTYEYDKANRLTTVIEHHDDGTIVRTSSEYDLMGNTISATDRYGETAYYEYDDFNRLRKITLPTNDTITKEYDLFDNVIAETDQNGHTTRFEYTARKQPCKITYADGAEERFAYNLDGTLAHKWDKSGTKTTYTYDLFGRVVKTETCDAVVINHYNAFHLLSTTDPMGYTTTYTYDDAGRKVKEEKQASQTTFEYDSLGRLSCTRRYAADGDYIASTTEYDLLNRVTLETKVDRKNQTLSWVSYHYDVAGNRTCTRSSHLEGIDAEIKTDFNSQAEPYQVTDELGHVTLHQMDHTMRQHTTTDPLGNVTEQQFDQLGRVVSLFKKNAQGILLAKTEFAYSGTGKKTKQVEHVCIDGIKSHEYVLTWDYDALDRVKQLTEPEGKITTYSYDASGRIKTIIKPDGIVLMHAYDALGRLTELTSSDATVHYTYTYDLHNNPLEIHDHVHNLITVRRYDAFDQILSDGVKGIFEQTFTYDALGRVTFITAPDSSTVTYEYADGYLRKIKRGTYEHRYDSFDLQGRVLKSSTGEFSWDKKGRMTKIVSSQYSLAIPEDGFDAVGNLKTMTFIDAIGKVECKASYDDLYQLVEESGVQAHSYKNDSLSNRHEKDSMHHTVDQTNKLINDGKACFAYDKNGNLINDGSNLYCYDALDRLIAVTCDDKTTRYIYDSMHRRIARITDDGKKEFFVYFGLREVGLLNDNLQLAQYRVLGLGKGAELGASIVIELDGAQYIPFHDNRGNIVSIVDAATGMPQETYRYTAFGECEVYDELGCKRASSINSWGFSSKRLDPETGFYYFHRRYYAPAQGRWITPDPLGFADGPNLYAYVHNNPMTHFDLYGLATTTDTAIFGLLASFSEPTSLPNEDTLLIRMNEAAFCLDFIEVGRIWRDASDEQRNALLADIENMVAATPMGLGVGTAIKVESAANRVGLFKRWESGYFKTPAAGRTIIDKTIQGSKTASHPFENSYVREIQAREPTVQGPSQKLPDGHMWTKASPFKEKTAEELHDMFINKGFQRTGADPKNGLGSYINPKNERQYRIDPKDIGRYREPNHVDVERPDDYKGNFGKKRFGYKDD